MRPKSGDNTAYAGPKKAIVRKKRTKVNAHIMRKSSRISS